MSIERFKISVIGKSYIVEADEGRSMDIIWASQKCWVGPGTRVLIEDEHGNHKIFEKEVHSWDENRKRKDREAHSGDDGQ